MSDISAFGITATLPSGWDGRIAKRPDPMAEAAPEVAPDTAPGAAPETGPDAGGRAAPDAAPEAAPGAPDQSAAAVVDGTENPVAHLANFPLPPNRGDYGSGAVETMGAGDILVCLVEFDPEAAGTDLFAHAGLPRFGLNDFAPHTMQRTIAGMCGAQTFFSEGGRAFSAYVVLGSFRLRAPLVPVVNELLAGLQIEPV